VNDPGHLAFEHGLSGDSVKTPRSARPPRGGAAVLTESSLSPEGSCELARRSMALDLDSRMEVAMKTDTPEFPMTVRDAARFLGVSPQTVYLWVERKQIPHLRVMGRNIRFLKSDLEPFRASFRQEMENG